MSRQETNAFGHGVVGVAGCGAMGLPMARNLFAAGIET